MVHANANQAEPRARRLAASAERMTEDCRRFGGSWGMDPPALLTTLLTYVLLPLSHKILTNSTDRLFNKILTLNDTIPTFVKNYGFSTVSRKLSPIRSRQKHNTAY